MTIGRECAAGFERLHNRFAFFHAIVHLVDRVSDDSIAGGLACDIERL